MANSDVMMRLRALAETKGFGLEPAPIYGCVRLWDPLLQADRPYADGSTAWPYRAAVMFLQKQGELRAPQQDETRGGQI
jgi:hypothetical protein